MILLTAAVCPLMEEAEARVSFLMGRTEWEKLTCSGGQGLSKVLIQLSTDGWGCTPSQVIVWPEATQPWGLWALW